MAKSKLSADQVDDLVAQVDTGARNPTNWQGKFILIVCFIWALFQLYIASNFRFTLTEYLQSIFAWLETVMSLPFEYTDISVIVTDSNARLIHLAFAFFLCALAFPLFKNSPRDRIPWYDWLLAGTGVVTCLYILVFREAISVRAGLPTTADLVMSSVGMVILGISVYRSLGLPLLVVASVFVIYVFFGDQRWLPEVIQWKGASFGKAMWHFWMQTEGVFGVALGVSATLIFLFVLFGSILEKAGAGNFFIKIAFSLLGQFRGGPAKAAVIASAMSGLYSGSSIANTVTTGTFTIPLMMRTGFSAEKAGAVEVASSTNGQLTPPVMGAAAFLIAEFTGVAYTDIIRHALVPALVSYIALVYIVHLEAMKMDLKGLPKPPSTMTWKMKVIGFLSGFIGIAALGMVVYYGLGWIKVVAPDAAFTVVILLCATIYLVLAWFASRLPDLVVDPPDSPIIELPRASSTSITGLYYLLPIVILIWCIVLERLSPALSAFWAAIAMIIVALTQHPIKSAMRGAGDLGAAFRQGVAEWTAGMIAGSRNMISIAVATGAAGIIVGTVSLTGAHQIIGEFVEFLSGGSLIVMLVLVAVMSLILGMGLPTTANYIVVSSLMAGVIVTLGAKSGLIVPLVAVHMFVFYFGILADDTPPVGLAAMAAAAISGGDPIKTGLQGFAYDIRTGLLPFLFLFNTELLLIDVGWAKGIFVFVIAVIAMMLFASATQSWFLVRNRIWESAILLLVAFSLFRPGFWLDQISPPYIIQSPDKIVEILGGIEADEPFRLQVRYENVDGNITTTTIELPSGPKAKGGERLTFAGIETRTEDGKVFIDNVLFNSPAKKQDVDLDWEIVDVRIAAERVLKELFYIPAVALLALVVFLQLRRRKKSQTA